MDNNDKTFRYSYSADRQTEIDEIRGKYLPKEETKMEQLRKLDASTTKSGMIASIAVGVVGTLLFGLGMTLTTGVSGELFIFGIVIGILGLIIMALASPIYRYMTKKQREKIAPQILKLTEELSDSEHQGHDGKYN